MTQITLSEHGYKKADLFNLHFKGGLLMSNRTQKIVGSIYDGTNELTPKFVLHFGLARENEDQFIEKPSSLRFDNYQQLESFIFHLLRANVHLGRKTNAITPQNFQPRLKKALEIVEENYRGFLD